MGGIKTPIFAGVFDEPVEELCKDEPEVEGIHFSGPHYIRNSEGAIAEVTLDNKGTVNSATFSGDRNQQWILHRHPSTSERKVAVMSFHDGRYLTASGTSCESSEVYVDKEPFYWKLATVVQGVYSLETDSPLGQLKIPATGPCTITDFDDESNLKQVDLIIVQKTPESDSSLVPVRSVIEPPPAIESEPEPAVPDAAVPENEMQHSYTDQEIYYTPGVPGTIIIMNHLSTLIYVAVSGAKGSTGQWPIKPEGAEYWIRCEDESAHVSLPGSIEGQGARVHRARLGMILHIQKMPRKDSWEGIQSVSVDAATYTSTPDLPNKIGIKNETAFDIHACVHSTIQGSGDTKVHTIKPNNTESWERTSPETVFVSIGSSPGVPRAYLGRPGFVLSITASE